MTNRALRKEGERVQESEYQGMRLSGHEILSKGERAVCRKESMATRREKMSERAESHILDKKNEFLKPCHTFPGFCNMKYNHILLPQ